MHLPMIVPLSAPLSLSPAAAAKLGGVAEAEADTAERREEERCTRLCTGKEVI